MIVQRRDFQLRQVEALTEHVDADDDPAVEPPQSGEILATLLERLLAVNDDGSVVRVGKRVEAMEMLGALNSTAPGHRQMIEAGIQIGGEHVTQLVDDRLVGVELIEAEHRLEPDRLEVPLLLRLLQRIGIDELPIDTAAIFAERCGCELDDRNGRRAFGEQSAKGCPGASPDVVRLIDEERRGSGRHMLLNRRFGAPGNMHGGDDDVGTVEDLIDLGDRGRNAGKPGDRGEQRRRIETRLCLQDAKRLELRGDLFAQRVRRNHDEQALKPLTRIKREHGLRLARAGRHDDRGWFRRASRMSKRGVKGADLRPPQSRIDGFVICGRTTFTQMKRILPGCRNPGQPLLHIPGAQSRRIDRLWMQPTPFTAFERITNGLSRGRAGYKQD